MSARIRTILDRSSRSSRGFWIATMNMRLIAEVILDLYLEFMAR